MSDFVNTFEGLEGVRFSPRSSPGNWIRPELLPVITVALLLAATISSARAQTEIISTPRELQLELPAAAPAMPAAAAAMPAAAPEAPTAVAVTVGLNFQGSELFVDSNFIPPDTMGAVGPGHIVEMINGRFDVYDMNGTETFTRTLSAFWTSVAGVTIPSFNDTCDLVADTCTVSGIPCTSDSDCLSNFVFDPRIVYDPASGRWFATSIDAKSPATGDNNIYVARSDTADPTGDWDGVRFDADTVGAAEFHDYDTLAVDADGLYICTNDFDAGGDESCYSIPKADLLLAAPSIANMTRFEATPAGLPSVSGSIQPALDFGTSDFSGPSTRAALLGASGGALTRSDILDAGAAGATLGAITAIAGDPGHNIPPDARQPHPALRTIENVAPRIVANVFEMGNSLWAVHAVEGTSNNSAIRWYEIDETTNTVLQTGLIEDVVDPEEDFHEPSIAVNSLGNVVIGYTCSGPSLSPSSCVSLGETTAGVTSFDPPVVLQTGAGHYWRDFADPPNNERNRWGDYSATVIDPDDPCTFWTFQEFVAVSAVGDVGPDPLPEGGRWGVQITELIFDSCAEADLSITKTDSPDSVVAGTNLVYTLTVENIGPSRARYVEVTDTLPAGVQFVSAFGTNWGCGQVASVVTCSWQGGNPTGSLADDQVANIITITVTVDPATIGVITNQATVSSATTDPVAGNNSESEDTTVIAEADLQMTKIASPDPVIAGTDITYTLEASNEGPSDAQNVQISDPLPANTTFVSATPSAGGTCVTPAVGTNGVVTCTWAGATRPVDPDDRSVTVVAHVLPSAPDGSTLTNTAGTSSDTDDPNPSNNSDTTVTDVIRRADLEVSKNATPDPVIAGGGLIFEIEITNNGPSDAANASLTEAIPDMTRFLSIQAAPGWNCVTPPPLNTGTVECTTPNFPALTSASFNMVVVVDSGIKESTVIENSVVTGSDTTDPDPDDNSSVAETVAVTGAPALGVIGMIGSLFVLLAVAGRSLRRMAARVG